MFCVGATKAGTSWLYRYLHAHPQCRLRSIKELHFFDTVDFSDYAHQLDTFARLRHDLGLRLAAASGWQEANLARQIADVEAVMAILATARDAGEAQALAGYRAYLAGRQGEGAGLMADITPGYALLSQARLAMMAALSPAVRFVYLMRDPVDRLWSHVRMQATRQRQPGEEVPLKARRILNRVVKRGMETHIPARGDYRAVVEKLRAAVPPAQLLIDCTERLFSDEGLARLCAFLGIGFRPADTDQREHEGVRLAMEPGQKKQAAAFLAPQYEFVERNFGPLPARWQANMVGI